MELRLYMTKGLNREKEGVALSCPQTSVNSLALKMHM